MSPAKYLVVIPPGAPVPQVGFVEHGKMFTAPDDYVPSLSFFPANEEAKEILAKVYADRKAQLEERVARAQRRGEKGADDAETIKVQLLELAAEGLKRQKVVGPAAAAPKIEQGLSMSELNALQTPPAPQDAQASPSKKGRAQEDRKL